MPHKSCAASLIVMGRAYCIEISRANALLDDRGPVKYADFGLAREDGKKGGISTNRVVAVWYRNPELILDATQYGAEVGMRSVGCLIAELLSGKPLFTGRGEGEQIAKIWRIIGSPNAKVWSGWTSLPLAVIAKVGNHPSSLEKCLRSIAEMTGAGVDHIESLLSLDPRNRPTA